MTDLLLTLPNFPTKSYTHLIPSLERTRITTSDLLTLDPLEVAKRARLPLLDVKRLINHITAALQGQLGIEASGKDFRGGINGAKVEERGARKEDGGSEIPEEDKGILRSNGLEMLERERKQRRISLLDEGLDAALDGGVKRGGITEFVGESGSGKTQLLLTLLLSVQLRDSPPSSAHYPENNPPSSAPTQPQSALYISTEAPLTTPRLQSILSTHPLLRSLSPTQQPSLDRIHSIQTPDLESQDHIIYYQVPVAVKRYNVGLVVIDSIAANYRAERVGDEDTGVENNGGEAAAARQESGLGKKGKPPSRGRQIGERAGQIIRLGRFLQELARREGLAVVVSNQVADRFLAAGGGGDDAGGCGGGGDGGVGGNMAMQRGVKRRREEAERSWMSSPVMRDRPLPPSSSDEHAPPFSSPSPGFFHPQMAATTTPKDKQQQQQQQHAIPPYSSSPQLSSNLPVRNATTGPFPHKPLDPLLLDHQLRFFTGWGDTLPPSSHSSSSQQQQRNQNLKTPCLGLPWANQLMCRVALIKEAAPPRVGDWLIDAARGGTSGEGGGGGGDEEGDDSISGTADVDASTNAGRTSVVAASTATATATTPFHSAPHSASLILANLTPAQRKLILDQQQQFQHQKSSLQSRITAHDDNPDNHNNDLNPTQTTTEGALGTDGGGANGGAQAPRAGSWHRYFKVVFSGYAPKSAAGLGREKLGRGFEIWEGGVRSV